MFMTDFARALPIPVQLEFMAVSSYGSATSSSGVVQILKDLDRDISGRNVLIVEDILDSGIDAVLVVAEPGDPPSGRVGGMYAVTQARRGPGQRAVAASASTSPKSSSLVMAWTIVSAIVNPLHRYPRPQGLRRLAVRRSVRFRFICAPERQLGPPGRV